MICFRSLHRIIRIGLPVLAFAFAVPGLAQSPVPPAAPTAAPSAPPAVPKAEPSTPVIAPPVTPAPPTEALITYTSADDNEVKLGRENAEENDKQVKLVTDAALVERVNRIGQEIAGVANRTPVPALWGSSQLKPFHFTFKVVDDKDVNAYSLPGGFIYVNRGLLDAVRSDDELAGVLAHEIGHDVHHHMVKLIRESNKLDKILTPLTLLALGVMVGARGSTSTDALNLLYASKLYAVARLNSYGVDAEKDADHTGLLLLTKTHYNPVGLYSFMIRLAALERGQSYVDLGIYRTHPPAEERVAAARNLLNELKIPILLSTVDPTLQATVAVTNNPKTGDLAEVKIRDVVLCRVAGTEMLTAEQRGRQVAQRMDVLLDMQLQPFEVRVNKDQTAVLVRGQSLLTASDAQAQSITVVEMARSLSDAISRIRQKRLLESRQ